MTKKITLEIGNIKVVGIYEDQGGHNLTWETMMDNKVVASGSTGAADTQEAYSILAKQVSF